MTGKQKNHITIQNRTQGEISTWSAETPANFEQKNSPSCEGLCEQKSF
jgi:hypothetical protein